MSSNKLYGEIAIEAYEKRVWVVRDAAGHIKSQAVPAAVLGKFSS